MADAVLSSEVFRVAGRWSKGFDGETLLGVFVVLQVVQCAMLAASGLLDLKVAACVSAGLIVVALMFTASRRDGACAATGPARVSGAVTGFEGALTGMESNGGLPSAAMPAPCPQTLPTQAWADLMARISHELRTPLNAVIGFSDLMEREIFGPLGNERYADYAGHIKDSGEALLKSAEDTLALSALMVATPAHERPQISDLGSLLDDAWRVLVATAARREIVLTMNVAGGVEIIGDRRACRQALLNIMSEAVRRAADGSAIVISVATQADRVQLIVDIADTVDGRTEAGPSLAVCVARTLLERLGTNLVICDAPGSGSWRAVTILDRSVQADFFPVHGWA